MIPRIAMGGTRVFGQVAQVGTRTPAPAITRATISMQGRQDAYPNPHVRSLPLPTMQQRFYSYNPSLRNPDNAERYQAFIDSHMKQERKITLEHMKQSQLKFNASTNERHIGAPGGEAESLGVAEVERFKQALIRNFVAHKDRKTNEEKRQEVSFLNAERKAELAEEYVQSKFGKRPKEREKDSDINTGLLFSNNHPGEVYKQSQKFIKQSRIFNEHLNEIMESGTSEEKIKALQRFLYQGVRKRDGKNFTGIERFNSSELKTIFTKLWELDAHDQMVEMMDTCENKHFITDPVNLVFYARAILKGHYINMHNAHAIANLLMENEESRAEGLAIKGTIHAMSRRAAEKMLHAIDTNQITESVKKEYQECFPGSNMEREAVLENYCKSLSGALVDFEEAFVDTWDCRYGCRAMHYLLEQKSPERAQQMAELTKLAAQKEGGLKSSNFAVVRAYLEALYVLPNSSAKEIELAQRVLISLCKTSSQVKNALEGITELRIEPDTHAVHRRGVAQDLTSHYFQLEEHPEEALEHIKRIKNQIQSSVDAWERYTFNYKGLKSNHIEGNFKFGAQLPAHNVNRYDRKFFEEILNTPLRDLFKTSDEAAYAFAKNLQQTKTFDQFNALVDAFIRERFHTDEWNLEQLDSEGHQLFDHSVQSLIALSGAPTRETRKLMPDSRTNISTNLILGLGDCRHHAQVKQILFDIWHGQQLDKVMKKIHKAEELGQQDKVNALRKKFNIIDAEQLHTLDCEVYLPIEMKNGLPVRHQGYLVKNKTGNSIKVEEHTLNVQMELDPETNKRKQVKLRDAFYQNTYPWSGCEIDLKDKDLTDGVNAGSVEIYDWETGKIESLPVVIKPTVYAGSRDLYDRGNNDNRFIGQPVKPVSFAEVHERQREIDQHLTQVREWYKQKAPKAD